MKVEWLVPLVGVLGALVAADEQIPLAEVASSPPGKEVMYRRAVEILANISESSEGGGGKSAGRARTLVDQIADAAGELVGWRPPTQEPAPVVEVPPAQDAGGGRRAEAISLLQQSKDMGSNEALSLLADMHLFGNYSQPRDLAKAFEYYSELADRGEPSAQFMVGLAYSTGLFGAVDVDQGLATLYYTFAAAGGDLRAKMAMGFRSIAAIAGPVDRRRAVDFYESAADKAMEYYLDGPGPEGLKLARHMPRNAWSIPDELYGGVYGRSRDSDGSESGRDSRYVYPQGVVTLEEAFDFFSYLADDTDDVCAHYAMALLLYDGGRYGEPDYARSVYYALKGALTFWNADAEPHRVRGAHRLPQQSAECIASCAGFLGQRFLRGEGVMLDPVAARKWFSAGAELDDAASLNGLGMLKLHGIGGDKDPDAAAALFKKALSGTRGLGLAELNMARYHEARDERAPMLDHLMRAAHRGDLEGTYLWAKQLGLHAAGPGWEEDAALLFKKVCERAEDVHSPLRWAQKMYALGDVDSAILGFLIAAEQGYEAAQLNVAFLLDETPGALELPASLSALGLGRHKTHSFNNASATALVYWTRLAKQISQRDPQVNRDAQVKAGDYYLAGLGTSRDPEKAAACYVTAADRLSGMAQWNLGWMHEHGVGVEQDYHLAKRYYDLSLVSGPEGYLPVKLALLQLHLKSWWNRVSGGKIRNISPENTPDLRVLWKQFWQKWSELDYWLTDDTDADDDHYDDDDGFHYGDYEATSDDILDALIILGFMGVFAVVMWYRHRQQVAFGRPVAVPPFGPAANQARPPPPPPPQPAPVRNDNPPDQADNENEFFDQP